MRLRPVGPAAAADFPPPSLSLGNDIAFLPPEAPGDRQGNAILDAFEGDPDSRWAPHVAAQRQDDGSYLYTSRVAAAPGFPFVPGKFCRLRFEYPKGVWRDSEEYTPAFAIYDMRLIDPQGNAYVMPSLAALRGNKARKQYFEGGEMGGN